jgi:DNA-binding response OmpR family regulator
MESKNGNNAQALIVEDDEDLSIIFTEALNMAGFVTKPFVTGRKR